MQVQYKSKNIEKVCTSAQAARKRYGDKMAQRIQMRIDQIRAAGSVEELIRFGIGRCHPLHENRKDQYAMDLVHPQRLVFEKLGTEIQIANILEIVDYH